MISIADVARELHLPEGQVLGACHDLGIVASSSASGLSSTEHRQLRDHFGGDDAELGDVPRGSTDQHPGEPGHHHEPSDQPTHAPIHDHPGGHQHEPTPGTWDTVVAERKAARKRTPVDAVRLPIRGSVRARTVVRASVLLFGVIALGMSLVGLASGGDGATSATCVDFTGGAARTVAADCAAPHDAEIVSVIALDDPDGPHPGTDELLARAEAACPDPPGGGDGGLTGVYLVPTAASWADGDRSVVCLVEDPAAPLVGALDLP